ncbi:allophanate hydrolase [Bacillus taeanensis]|uniref:Allophanate hydrolase n=1 Tax=Bacillus taeanensis TaxID=273032 RepID=A0A366XRW5_9BACI|nr:allophanate hydrolase [Bacillus taeanensis]RBW67865.1 allophanate hydrolase [Bacillus taeanensis]
MRKIDIPSKLTLAWLREKYQNHELAPEEVIEEVIERAKKDEEMNIWITVPKLEHIQPYLDRLAELDMNAAPLWGIPFAIKDNIDLADVPTTAGCEEFSYTPTEHASVVKRLIEAGAIPVGKTNLDQFATGLVGTRSPYGEAHNSLRPELISGGSSSGSAVSVARGQAVFSLGTDTAGSGRVPAALNNLVGLKPSLGAWPTKGVVPACASLDCVTVFSHNLEDAYRVDAVARGLDSEDPWSRELPIPQGKLPKKICLPEGPLTFYGPFAEQYEKAWNETVEKVKKLNIPVETIDYNFFSEAAAILYDGPFVAERWADLGGFINDHPGVTFPVTEKVLRSGAQPKYDAASVFNAMHKLQEFKRRASILLKDAVLVTPTAGGTWTRDEVRNDPIKTNRDMGLYTNHCNLLDLCAVAVQAGEADTNLPFGITLFALANDEGLIAGAAEAFVNKNQSKAKQETTLVAVCGLHMRGFPLEKQMLEFGATFVREAKTAESYQFIKLATEPTKPGLIKKKSGGKAIEIEVWEMPLASFGAFAALIPAPLGIGKIELQDGSEVPGFICEGYAAEDAEDISDAGSWRKVPLNI